MPSRPFFWSEMTSAEFTALDPERTIAILPVAATEQHGPHLPVATDTAIAEGMLGVLRARLPVDLAVRVLPILPIGKSNEHIFSPGTLTLSAETLGAMLLEIGASLDRAGIRKVILSNSHGGNVPSLATAAREYRVRYGMLAVATHWRFFGLPGGMFDETESKHGIHAGDIETSLMLHFRPDLVRKEKVKNFVSNAVAMEREFKYLSATGPHAFGWIAPDLNADGAVGNASIATAEKGEATAIHQADGFIGLVREMTDFSLSRLAPLPKRDHA